ncbi:MAG: bifunctional phosphoribosylaminoimidazolecarboxamide formyltransferase/IMP cyclohydrolase [Armatimonadota bacterium]|nr:bifunctional phosphoribosylaminoimidazolecarboxamide formyltransferase/IMP cyclohydrolase [Armatimonadota bacterium]
MKGGRALLSVSDKTGIVELAQALRDAGMEIVSTGGTAARLREAGLDVRPLEQVTGFPELLGGRVKTLHPAIHAGLLARGDLADLAELARHAIRPIDLVAVTLYPFERAVAAGAAMPAVLDEIDIGGVTLLRAAAKNWPRVTVLCDPGQYAEVRAALRERGEVPEDMRLRLAAAAFARVAAYDAAIAAYFQRAVTPPAAAVTAPEAVGRPPLPDLLQLAYRKKLDLRYGENPHQRAALYATAIPIPGTVVHADVLGGRALSYNNIADLDAGWGLVQDLPRPAVAVIKHLNPCGAATGASVAEAFVRARDGDPVAAFGGVVASNAPVDLPAAQAMGGLFLEAIIAPSFTPEAAAHLQGKKNLRLLAAGEPAPAAGPEAPRGLDVRSVRGGLLAQESDVLGRDTSGWRVVTERIPSSAEWDDMRFAWAVCAHVKSNAIVFAAQRQVVGVGAGQMSRVDSVRLAAIKAGDRAKGAVAASDAFFPFADGIEAAAAAGVVAVIQPGGSIRDAEVIAAANRLGLAMVVTGERHFRH